MQLEIQSDSLIPKTGYHHLILNSIKPVQSTTEHKQNFFKIRHPIGIPKRPEPKSYLLDRWLAFYFFLTRLDSTPEQREGRKEADVAVTWK